MRLDFESKAPICTKKKGGNFHHFSFKKETQMILSTQDIRIVYLFDQIYKISSQAHVTKPTIWP